MNELSKNTLPLYLPQNSPKITIIFTLAPLHVVASTEKHINNNIDQFISFNFPTHI